MDQELIYWMVGLFVTTIGGWGSTFLKGYFDNKSRQKELSGMNTSMKQSFRGFERELTDLGRKVDTLKKDNDFRNVLRNSIRSKATEIVNLSFGLEQHYKDLMMSWAQKIEEMALRFYYSAYRGKGARKELEKYLNADFESKQAIMRIMTNDCIKDIRVLNNKDKKGLLFSDFIEEMKIYRKFDALINILGQNGYHDGNDVVKQFVDFVGDYFESYITTINVWKTLDFKDYNNFKNAS